MRDDGGIGHTDGILSNDPIQCAESNQRVTRRWHNSARHAACYVAVVRCFIFGFCLAFLVGGCSQNAGDTSLDGVNGLAGDADTEDAAQPFVGPCDATGIWKLTYERVVEDDCEPISIEDTIAIAPTETPPVSLPNELSQSEMQSASIENDGCTIKAHWGWEDWMGDPGGEMEGVDDTLELTLTSPSTGEGTLIHSQHWWCGSYGTRTFLAHAARADD